MCILLELNDLFSRNNEFFSIGPQKHSRVQPNQTLGKIRQCVFSIKVTKEEKMRFLA